ncbi:hypothetical protein HZA75_06670 [Candidatus Roizmanbacteria bacterium]|nr:hypothetical protein [Candidatus Roizmanbacteria bacterium]
MPINEAIITFVLIIWSLIWRGLALWRAAKQAQRNWFIVLLVVNTVGILDIVYLFRFSNKRMTIKELKELLRNFFTTSKSK